MQWNGGTLSQETEFTSLRHFIQNYQNQNNLILIIIATITKHNIMISTVTITITITHTKTEGKSLQVNTTNKQTNRQLQNRNTIIQ